MSQEEPAPKLFYEGGRDEDRNRRVSEPLLDYLEISGHWGHDRIREQLELMVAALPKGHSERMASRLRDSDHRRVKDAVTELVVHQALLEAGRNDIEVEPPTADGESDYRLSSLGVHFEVTRIGESDTVHGTKQRIYQVVQELNRMDCGRFSLSARLHSGNAQPSVKRVRRGIEEWLGTLDADRERSALEADPTLYDKPRTRIEFGDWAIDLIAAPLVAGAPSESIIAQFSEPLSPGAVTVDSIRAALTKKRKQHRRLTEPLVIVLDVSQGMLSDSSLADAFYGARPLAGWDRPADADALWPTPERSGSETSPSVRTPNIIGVLVLDHLQMNSLTAVEARLWLPPGATAPPLSGPWATARWTDGAPYGADVRREEPPQQYLLRLA